MRRPELRQPVWVGVSVPAAVLAVLILISRPDHSFFDVLELDGQYDLLFELAHKAPKIDKRLVLFQMDDKTAKALGYPVTRDKHAALARSLASTGVVRGMVWDVIWSHETKYDDELAQAFASLPVALGMGTAVDRSQKEGYFAARDLRNIAIGDPARWDAWRNDPRIPTVDFTEAITVDPVRLAVRAGGHVQKSVDYGGTFRKLYLVQLVESCVRFGPIGCEETELVPIPALGLAGVLIALDVPNDDVEWRDGTIRIGARTLDEPIDVPLDSDGRFLINHIEDWAHELDSREYASQLESLDFAPEAMAPGLDGKVVIVGGVYSGVGDFVQLPHEQDPVPGVVITINVMNTILTSSYLGEVPHAYVWILTVLLVVFLGGFATLARPGAVGSLALVFAVALVVVPITLFRWSGVFFPTTIPFLGSLLTAGAIAVIGHTREHRRASNTSRILSRFVSPALLSELEANGNREFLPEPQRAEITVLFADIASFTPFTEASDPEALSSFLDLFYEMSMDVLFAHSGTLDKFQGDGVLAYFGAPEPIEDKEEKAVRSAIAICERFYEMRDAHDMAAGLGIRCGIATGVSAVGYFGGLRYANYTIVGHHVNMAARLQGQARVGDVLMDHDTAKKLPDEIVIEELESIRLKGIAEPVPVWRVSVDQKSESSQRPSSSEESLLSESE